MRRPELAGVGRQHLADGSYEDNCVFRSTRTQIASGSHSSCYEAYIGGGELNFSSTSALKAEFYFFVGGKPIFLPWASRTAKTVTNLAAFFFLQLLSMRHMEPSTYIPKVVKTYKAKACSDCLPAESIHTPREPGQRITRSLGPVAPGPREPRLNSARRMKVGSGGQMSLLAKEAQL
jgi:hypothetical protein